MHINYQKMKNHSQANLHYDKYRKFIERQIIEHPEQSGYYFSLAVVLARMGNAFPYLQPA